MWPGSALAAGYHVTNPAGHAAADTPGPGAL